MKRQGLYNSVNNHRDADKYFVVKVTDTKQKEGSRTPRKVSKNSQVGAEDSLGPIVIRISQHIKQRHLRGSIQESGLFTKLNEQTS